MTVIVIQYDQIQSISERGIIYHDDSGASGFIYFEDCYQNYLRPRLTQEAYTLYLSYEREKSVSFDLYAARHIAWRQVGRRNIAGEFLGGLSNMIYEGSGKPFIVFYTQPPIAVECDDYDIFYELCSKIGQAGWSTYDEA